MSQIILVVEDKKDEQMIAKQAVLDSGSKIIIADTLNKAEDFIEKFGSKLSGIITDIHLPMQDDINAEGANGLSVVITALQRSVPCAVCTDDVSHGARYVSLVLERLEVLTSEQIPVSGSKDWDEVLQKLLTIM